MIGGFIALFVALLLALSEPVYFSPETIRLIREGRYRSKENRIAFSARDLDEFTNTSALRRSLHLDDPSDSSREKLAKRRKGKGRSRRE